MKSELEKMEDKKDNWMLTTVMLSVFLFVSVMINVAQNQHEKQTVEFLEKMNKNHNSLLVQKLAVENNMLSVAVNNVYLYNIKTYPEAMQKMIIAARDGRKFDFDFYIRKMQEENLKTIKNK